MKATHVIVIGAGAAGLMAAYKLSSQGKKVIVLEARDRIGGRINTIAGPSGPIELGAEFIHGDLPVTLALLNEAEIAYQPASGEMIRFTDGEFNDDEAFIEEWDLLIEKLNKLTTDTSIYEFLQDAFGGDKYRKLRDSVWKYVLGYDTADPRRASAFALRKEWQSEDEDAQHRVAGGYCTMINYLADKIKEAGGDIYTSSIATQINWKPNAVEVVTSDGKKYLSSAAVVAMPLGVLQSVDNDAGAIWFQPAIAEHAEAINSLGFGAVIKFLLQFDEPFWDLITYGKHQQKNLHKVGYILSDEEIPTWWTQPPGHAPLLTGWIGGPAAAEKKNVSDVVLLEQALTSLGRIFNIETAVLKVKLVNWHVVNWTTEPLTLGSYSYDTVAAPGARQLLNDGVAGTVYFAGEYLYEGPAMGTVEAALTSGADVAKKISA